MWQWASVALAGNLNSGVLVLGSGAMQVFVIGLFPHGQLD